MSIFLSDSEREVFKKIGSDPIFAGHYWALFTRVTDKVNNLEQEQPLVVDPFQKPEAGTIIHAE